MRRRDHNALTFRLMDWMYRLLLVVVLAVAWISFQALPLHIDMQSFIVVMAGYTMLLITLQRIYHACGYGLAKVGELILSQTLAILLCMAALYLCSALYTHRLYLPIQLCGVVVLQVIISVLWSVLVNHLWFRWHRAPRTAIIYDTPSSLQALYKTPYFTEKYDVCKLIENPADIAAVSAEVENCEVLFTVGIPATLTNGIAKLCLEKNVQGLFVPHLGHIILSGGAYVSGFSVPVLHVQRGGPDHNYRAVKRVLDVVLSLIGIVVTLPIMLVTALAIRHEDKGPVLYRQTRLTKDGREFSILKFRSMTIHAEQDGVARLVNENDTRITRVGRLIRSCRIDELPQLFNILRGDMSIVGPRPERPEIAVQYEQALPEFALRLQVKAGLTGMAQVYGRYNTEPYNKLQMDLMYINEMSMMTDLRLLVATVKTIFARESTQGVATGQETALNASDDQMNRSA